MPLGRRQCVEIRACSGESASRGGCGTDVRPVRRRGTLERAGRADVIVFESERQASVSLRAEVPWLTSRLSRVACARRSCNFSYYPFLIN